MSPTSDKDIWRSANLLIQQHGEDAGIHAAQMVDKFLEEGDLGGHKTWLRILKAIESFEDKTPSGPVH